MAAKTLIRSNFGKNLWFLMNRDKLNTVKLAEYVGISGESIVKLRKSELSNPTLKTLLGIAKYFKISISELVFDDLSQPQLRKKFVESTSYIPIINWSNLPNWRNSEANEFAAVIKEFDGEVFALRMDSDCGLFSAGTIIFVDPTKALQNNNYALVLNTTNSIVSVKQIIADGSYYLQSVNPKINTIVKFDEAEYSIYGIIVGYQKTEFF
ncbi:MAG: helix-turn-helix domain-containing protein [Burkholderiales bacterium]|nr:helix-turn-helix domain-containing protein [Burkholderiales bacterium]